MSQSIKPVKGFLTSDGRFFESATGARIAEATSKLLMALVDTPFEHLREDFILAVQHKMSEIKEYVDACYEGKKETNGISNSEVARAKQPDSV